MKASELRIGNLVKKGKNKIVEVDSISELGINIEHDSLTLFFEPFNPFGNGNNNDVIKPIPLTEEWLVKFGFMQYIDFGVKMGTYDKIPLCGFTYSIHTKKVMIMHKGNSISHWLDVEIKYVHQLQNLYFARTGQELTISNAN